MDNIHFILDTNAYIQLVGVKYLCALQPTASEMRKREAKVNSQSKMSIVVTMELLKHFDETDPFFMTCFKALTLQYFHTQTKNYGEPDNNINFIPPLNTLLTQHFFNKSSELFKYYLRIIEIAENATKNIKPLDFKKDKSAIETIAQQLICERREVQQNLEDFIKSCNGGAIDWELFKNNTSLRKLLLKDIKEGNTIWLMAESLCRRAHLILELNFPKPDLDKKLVKFIEYYKPLLKLYQSIIQKLVNGVIALSDPLNEKWNTLNDIQIIGAACFNNYQERNKGIRTIIVTDDKAIHFACKDTCMADNVWKLNKYLSFIY